MTTSDLQQDATRSIHRKCSIGTLGEQMLSFIPLNRTLKPKKKNKSKSPRIKSSKASSPDFTLDCFSTSYNEISIQSSFGQPKAYLSTYLQLTLVYLFQIQFLIRGFLTAISRLSQRHQRIPQPSDSCLRMRSHIQLR